MVKSPDRPQAEGDAQSAELAAWMALYGPALHRFFAKRAGVGEADDLVQEVFLRLQARHQSEPVDNPEGYLFRTAKHVLIDRRRHDRARGLSLREMFDETRVGANEFSPERILAAKQEYARLIVAILALPPRARAAFLLHRFDKLSYRAIAVRMGISKRSVQELIQRALSRIDKDIGHREEEGA